MDWGALQALIPGRPLLEKPDTWSSNTSPSTCHTAPLPWAHGNGFRCGSRRNSLALVASSHDEAASGRRERYSRALARKGHGGPGLVEQNGGLFKSFDAAFDAKSNDEKNHRAVEVRISMYSIRQKARTVVRPRSRLACQSPNPCSGNCRSGSLVRSLVPQSAFDKSLRKQNGLPVRCVHATETRASGKGWAWAWIGQPSLVRNWPDTDEASRPGFGRYRRHSGCSARIFEPPPVSRCWRCCKTMRLREPSRANPRSRSSLRRQESHSASCRSAYSCDE